MNLPADPKARKKIPQASPAIGRMAAREARRLGRSRYFTGNPCPRGHISERRLITRSCIACDKEKERKRCPIKARERARRASWKRNGLPTPTRPRSDNCELCGGPPTARALHLDHDKKTGKFRGWLCHYCNTNLGRFGDNKAGLLQALAYLERAE